MDFMEKVTELSKKVGASAEKTYAAAKDKSEKLIEEAKLNIIIADKESEIKEIYQEMGNIIYDSYKAGEKTAPKYVKKCKMIEKINKKIEEMSTEINHLKGFRKCNECSEIINIDDKFCINCGKEQKAIKVKLKEKKESKENKEEEKKATKACKSCGQVASSDVKFCSKCGYKF